MDNDTNDTEMILVNEDYSERKKPRPVRVPDQLYKDFNKIVPFGIGYAPMMVNLMIYFIHNRETVLDFINRLKTEKSSPTADVG